MPLRHTNLLSKLSITMEPLGPLLDAEQVALDDLSARLVQLAREFAINTSSATVSRYEAIFGLNNPNRTAADRRAALIVHLNTRPPITKQYLEELLATVTGCNVRIEEYFSEYRFTIFIRSQVYSPDMRIVASYVKLLKPAHLEATLRLQRANSGTVLLASRTKIGRRIGSRPYQAIELSMEAPLLMTIHTKIGRHIKGTPKGE